MSIEHWALNKQEGTCSFGRFCVKDCPNFQIGVEGWSIIAIAPNYFRTSPSFINQTKLLGSPILKMDLLIGKSSAWLEPSLLEKIEDLHIYVITENDLLCFPSAHGPKPLLVHLSIVQTSFCLQMPSLTSSEMTQMLSTTYFNSSYTFLLFLEFQILPITKSWEPPLCFLRCCHNNWQHTAAAINSAEICVLLHI